MAAKEHKERKERRSNDDRRETTDRASPSESGRHSLCSLRSFAANFSFQVSPVLDPLCPCLAGLARHSLCQRTSHDLNEAIVEEAALEWLEELGHAGGSGRISRPVNRHP